MTEHESEGRCGGADCGVLAVQSPQSLENGWIIRKAKVFRLIALGLSRPRSVKVFRCSGLANLSFFLAFVLLELL